MATQTGTTLKTYFNTGDKPTEAQFADLIDSNLNLTDGGTSTGTVNLQSDIPLVFTSGSTTDDFYAIAPPMIRGLIPGLKVWDLFSDSLGTELPTDDSTTTSPWLFDNADSAAVAKVNNDVDFDEGAISLTTGNGVGNQTAIFTKATSFKCVAGTKWWAEAEFKTAANNTTELFFGVIEEAATTNDFHLTAAGDGADRVGFVKKAHDNDAIEYAVNKGSAGTIATALSPAIALDTDNDILHLGIYWDGTNVKFYSGAVWATGAARGPITLKANISSNIPDDSNLGLVLFAQTGGSATKTITINKLRGAIWS